jgi:hypothetical protein
MRFYVSASIFVFYILAGNLAVAQTIGTPGVPSGFGLAGGSVGLSGSGSYGPDRGDTKLDASSGLTFGFGNPVTGVGIQTGANLTSFRDFGASGYFTYGLHKMFQTSDAGIYSVALNVSHIAPWGDARQSDPGYSLLGSYLTSFGSNLALITVGVGNDMNDERDVRGIFGIGMGIGENYAVSLGQVGDRIALGLTMSPTLLAGNSLSVSINHDASSNENTLAVDVSRSFYLFKN